MVINKIIERIKKDGHLYAPVDAISYNNILHKRNIYVEGLTVLDIGAHWGAISFDLEKLGKEVHAVESGSENFEILKGLKKYYNSNIHIYNEDIFDFKPQKFDAVVALNIFHHFLRDKIRFEKFRILLKSFEIKEMILQVPETKDFYVYYKAYKMMDVEEFAEFIIENSCLNNVDYLKKDIFESPYFNRVICRLY